jgi:hypothetical protein
MAALATPGSAQTGGAQFKAVWERADYPVATGRAQRSWLWGPAPFDTKMEPLAESPGGTRQVQYYDKARMEINDPRADASSPFFVTNGLLVYEMISGRMQVGNNKFEQREPANILVAGDQPITMNPVNFTPLYATLAKVASLTPGQNQAQPRSGQQVKETLSADGTVGSDTPQGVGDLPKLQVYEKTTGHNIPDVFWAFMNQRGIVYEGDQFKDGLVFDWVSTMGYPITEPYWIQITIGVKRVPVMMQAFQRRMLTYNPANVAAWRVEMGNVGRQYYEWRYGTQPPAPAPNSQALDMKRVTFEDTFSARQYSAIDQQLYTTVTNQNDWGILWDRHTAKFDQVSRPPQVDFTTSFVVVAFWGDKPSGCYRLDIQKAELRQGDIYITVNQYVQQGGCATVITQPHDMAVVSRTGLPAGKYNVVFVDTAGNVLSQSTLTLP